jgi:hypothetical protein
MTSTVTNYSDTIDTTYPVAGVDNDTQGFRTNFAAIKNAFTATSNEITALQLAVSEAATTSTAFATTVANIVTATVWANVSSFISTSTTYAVAAPTTSKGSPSDVKGMIFANTASVFVCYKTWANDNSDIWAKVSTVGQTW